ncbi:MAG: hypothetical protein JWQ42_1601 [Edaphobacter sp.]|nr:hypothetical protein [Edaphobacter sp.]
MKSHITGMIFFVFNIDRICITCGRAGSSAFSRKIVVGSGNELRCRLDKSLRITKSGEPVTARLVEPVYIGTTLAIPEGSKIVGYVSSVSTAPLNKRTARLLNGDFTPPQPADRQRDL